MSVTLQVLSRDPPCHVLRIDEAVILLDCGSLSHSYDPELISKLEQIAPSISLVLLSHPLPSSLGLFPLLVHRLGLSPTAAIYASPPTKELGRLACQEWVRQRKSEQDPCLNFHETGKITSKLDHPNNNNNNEIENGGQGENEPNKIQAQKKQGWMVTDREVVTAFEMIKSIRWSSPIHLQDVNETLTLVAQQAGHTLGGTLWILRSATLTAPFLYAPAFNHTKEKHLDALSLPPRPGPSLIVSSKRSTFNSAKTFDKNSKILDTVTQTLRAGKSLLLPVDASARLLELLVLLDQHWAYSKLQKFPLCLVTSTSKDLQQAIRNQSEFLGSNYFKAVGDRGRDGKNNFQNVMFYSTLEDFNNAHPPEKEGNHPSSPAKPKLVLAYPQSLSFGFSYRLFLSHFSKTEGNVILLSEKPEEAPNQDSEALSNQGQSLASLLWNQWNDGQKEGCKWGQGQVGDKVEIDQKLELNVRSKRYLKDNELKEYLEEQKLEKERQRKHQIALERSRRMREAAVQEGEDDDESDDEDDDEDDDDNDVDSNLDEHDDHHRRRESSKLNGSLLNADASESAPQLDNSNNNNLKREASDDQDAGRKRVKLEDESALPTTTTSSAKKEEDQQEEIVTSSSSTKKSTGGGGNIPGSSGGGGSGGSGNAGTGLGATGTAWDEFLDAQSAHGVFDIYVRGSTHGFLHEGDPHHHYAKKLSLKNGEKANEPTRVRMFPFFERRRKVDAFGEVIDVKGWLMRRTMMFDGPEGPDGILAQEDMVDEAGRFAKNRKEEALDEERLDPPHKYTTEKVELQLKVSVFAVDCQGLSDGRALKTLIPSMQPKRITLIMGDGQDCQDLTLACRSSATTEISEKDKWILTATDSSEPVVIGETLRSFSVKLDDELLSSLQMRLVEDTEVVRVTGVIDISEEASMATLRKSTHLGSVPITPWKQIDNMIKQEVEEGGGHTRMEVDGKETDKDKKDDNDIEEQSGGVVDDPYSKVLPKLAPPLFIGDLRLAALRQHLTLLRIPAAFAGEGVLVCGPVSTSTATTGASSDDPRKNKADPRKRGKSLKKDEVDPEDDTSGGQVAVRKGESGQLILEGCAGETFSAVRQAVYALHAAAG